MSKSIVIRSISVCDLSQFLTLSSSDASSNSSILWFVTSDHLGDDSPLVHSAPSSSLYGTQPSAKLSKGAPDIYFQIRLEPDLAEFHLKVGKIKYGQTGFLQCG